MGVENNECVIATTWSDVCLAEFDKWLETDILPDFRNLFATVPALVNGKKDVENAQNDIAEIIEKHTGGPPEYLTEALNSGDGVYRP